MKGATPWWAEMTDAEILCAAVKIMSRDYEHLPQKEGD